jgi:hypothetical protein
VENDSIRASGANTLVDIWVEGKLRAICVTREAIDVFTGFDGSAHDEQSRCEFVRTHLPEIVTGVKERLRNGNAAAETIIIDSGQIAAGADARSGDRRKGERRNAVESAAALPNGERRRSERRKSGRRRPGPRAKA